MAENVSYTLKIAENKTNSCLRISYTTDGCIKSIFINCQKYIYIYIYKYPRATLILIAPL